MNAYAVSLSKYVNTGILVLFTLLSYLGFALRGKRLLHTVEIVQRVLLAAFLINANLTIAWFVRGAQGRWLVILCAMEVLFLLSFMTLYRIVHEMANMLLFNNICMLLSIGFVMITRISYYGSPEETLYRANLPIKQFVMALVGLLLMLVIPFFRKVFDAMRHLGLVFGILGIAALAGVLVLSVAVNGANITYTIAGFTFQPSEFVKILFILMLAGLLSGEVTLARALFVTLLSVLHVGILVLSRDLGGALIFFAVYLMMLFLATARWRVVLGGILLGAMGSVLCYFLFSHVRVRVLIWRDPLADGIIDGLGYQIAQSLFALGYGGLWGAGLTQGSPASIPLVESDFIFSAIVEEMGLIFGICLLFLCINCFLRILALSAGYSNRFFQLFTYGVAVCYIFQTFLTVGGETKFIPLTGVTLPLVSYGGSSILSTLIMLGIVEMIFILHDERTARFMERYEREHAEDGFGGASNAAASGFYGAEPGYYGAEYESHGAEPGYYGADYESRDAYPGVRETPGQEPAGGYDRFPGMSYGAGTGYGSTYGNMNGNAYGNTYGLAGSLDHLQEEPAHGASGEEGRDDMPENFPVNGVSEEGIFEDY